MLVPEDAYTLMLMAPVGELPTAPTAGAAVVDASQLPRQPAHAVSHRLRQGRHAGGLGSHADGRPERRAAAGLVDAVTAEATLIREEIATDEEAADEEEEDAEVA